MFFGDFQIRTVFSPIHSTNRLPLGNDDFPVELPIYPDPNEIIHISSLPYEGGLFLNYSSNFGELSFSYLETICFANSNAFLLFNIPKITFGLMLLFFKYLIIVNQSFSINLGVLYFVVICLIKRFDFNICVSHK